MLYVRFFHDCACINRVYCYADYYLGNITVLHFTERWTAQSQYFWFRTYHNITSVFLDGRYFHQLLSLEEKTG
jgi:hypothetical protein